jgi:hypothetical protein
VHSIPLVKLEQLYTPHASFSNLWYGVRGTLFSNKQKTTGHLVRSQGQMDTSRGATEGFHLKTKGAGQR